MSYLLIQSTVEDYAKWKSAFDEYATNRKTSGSKGGELFRSADNPNEITILFEWDVLDNARQFTQSDDLRQAMQRAGVVGRPDLYFLEEVEKVRA
jgi:heme-degrading monooxygenase HmoA